MWDYKFFVLFFLASSKAMQNVKAARSDFNLTVKRCDTEFDLKLFVHGTTAQARPTQQQDDSSLSQIS